MRLRTFSPGSRDWRNATDKKSPQSGRFFFDRPYMLCINIIIDF